MKFQARCEFDSSVTSIPQTLPITVTKLSITGGSIDELKNSDLVRYVNVEELRLSRNKLTKVHPYAFANLTKLRSVSIQKNQLNSIDAYTFAGLKNLKEILLIGNQIKTIRKFAFDHSSSIETVDLRRNPTERLESNAFSNFNDVQSIHLPQNLKIIEPNAFFGLANVHFLYLGSMTVDSIGPEMFNGLGPVNAMVIRQSELGLIKPKTFSKMNNVKHVLIEKCNIKRIRKNSFDDSKVGVLEMNSNSISRLENNATISSDKLKMSENKIDCQCRNLWITKSNDSNLMYKNYCYNTEDEDSSPNFIELDPKYRKNCDEFTNDDDYYEFSRACTTNCSDMNRLMGALTVLLLLRKSSLLY